MHISGRKMVVFDNICKILIQLLYHYLILYVFCMMRVLGKNRRMISSVKEQRYFLTFNLLFMEHMASIIQWSSESPFLIWEWTSKSGTPPYDTLLTSRWEATCYATGCKIPVMLATQTLWPQTQSCLVRGGGCLCKRQGMSSLIAEQMCLSLLHYTAAIAH